VRVGSISSDRSVAVTPDEKMAPRSKIMKRETPREELADLGLVEVIRANAGWLGITITGATDA